MIETSAQASDALGARHPQEVGLDEPDIMRAVNVRIEKALSLLAEGQWAAVREAADLLRRRILALGKIRDAAIYVDPGLEKGPNDINAEQVRLAVRWVRRVSEVAYARRLKTRVKTRNTGPAACFRYPDRTPEAQHKTCRG